MNPPINTLRLNCHDRCTETKLHSVCHLAPRLRAKVLDSMIVRVNDLSQIESKQVTKKIWAYAQLEEMWKR